MPVSLSRVVITWAEVRASHQLRATHFACNFIIPFRRNTQHTAWQTLSDDPGSSSGEQEMRANDRARHRASVGLWLKSARSAPDPNLNRLILSLFRMHWLL